MKKILTTQNLLFISLNIFSVFLLYYFYKNDFASLIIIKQLFFLIILWLPLLIQKIINKKFPKFLYQLYLVIFVLDVLIGNTFMFYKISNIYKCFVLFLEGIIFYLIGTWLIKLLDDYGFLSFKLINLFSFTFSVTFSCIKELIIYFFERIFKSDAVALFPNLLILSSAASFCFLAIYLDSKYNSLKYFLYIDKLISK